MGVGVGGGPGGAPGDFGYGGSEASLGGYGSGSNYGGSTSFGGGGTGTSPGMPPMGPPVTAAIPTLATQSLMGAQQAHQLNEQAAQQSLMPANEANAMSAANILGQGAPGMSFGYGGNDVAAGGGSAPVGGLFGKIFGVANTLANVFGFANPPALAAKAGLTFVGTTLANLFDGQQPETAIRGGVLAAVTSAIPGSGLVIGALPSDATGDVSGLGQGFPGNAEGMAQGLVGQGMSQGMVPGVGAMAPVSVTAPVQTQARGPSPALAATQPNYFGMKRVNLPWASWPQAATKQYGMKRVA